MDEKMFVLLLVGFTVTVVTGQQEAAIASCVEGATATEIIATFRVDKKTVDLTEATAYSQDGATAQTGVCTVGFTGNIAELVLTFDTTGVLPCGIEQDGTTMTQYNIRVHAIGPSIDQAYTFSCSLPASGTMVTSGALTVNGKLPVYPLYERTRKVSFMARYTDNDLPATTLPLGRSIYYSLTLCKGTASYENTNWGRKFHVGYLITDPLSELSLDIYTPAIGTRVRVTGIKAMEAFNEIISVSRDMPFRFQIPSTYLPTTGVEDLGISIEGLDDVIGVRVNNDRGTGNLQTDSYVAFPDDALEAGTYRIHSTPTGSGGVTTAHVVIVGIEAATMVTLNDDAGIGILPLAAATHVETLNSQQTYTLVCGASCDGISVTADKPVAVISGNGMDVLAVVAGHLVTPALPSTKFGSKFVIVNMDAAYSFQTDYKILLETPDFTTGVNWDLPSGTVSIHDGSIPIGMGGTVGVYSAEELQIDPGAGMVASVTQFIYGTAAVGPSMVVIPPVEAWGTEQVVPVSAGVAYVWILVSTKDDVGNIVYSTTTDNTGTTVSAITPSPAFVDVQQITGAVANYELAAIETTVAAGINWAKFKSTTPFMLLSYEVLADGRLQAYAPFGQRTPSLNPAGGCTPVVPDAAGFYPGVRMGNGVDDDCDGAVDEELPNGIDDDSDGKIDEDTAAAPAMGGDFVALYNNGMSIAADNAFSLPTGIAPTDVILPSGCNAHAGNDVMKDVIASVGHFTASTDDNSKYPDYYTIRTSDFMVFRFANTPAFWARATVALQDDTTGLATDSCSAKRKRRDVGGNTRQETVYLNLNIVDIPENKTATEKTSTETCMVDVTFWSVVTVLLVALASEVAIVTVLRKEKIQQF